ncbi:MAG: ATP-binding protein [Promethearchaeota archaeon]
MEYIVILIILGISIYISSINSHLLRGDYKWRHGGLYYHGFAKIYYRIEWIMMKILLKLVSSRIMKRFKVLRYFIRDILAIGATGEVYTLNECYKILDSLYKDYPNVYVGMRICACRQARGYYSKDLSNITDLMFIFSEVPNEKLKKPLIYTKYITLDHAKRLLRKFDKEGFVHSMFGACARFLDGSASVSICNCRRDTCIPMETCLDHNAFNYHKPHNLAIINQSKCKGIKDCGQCLEFCHFDARIIDSANGKIKILNEKCMGCALCLTHCPQGANSIKFIPNKVWYYQNLFKKIAKQHKMLPSEKHPREYASQYPYNYAKD